ncbi:MAG: type II toxin-antitoxin system PemK/MazF family toxin [Defluviitaleaceae bacterium]|nr:type II toxin-antitoxin system PemK/MazF family toxin [Defluviitaleaceae bacterium]
MMHPYHLHIAYVSWGGDGKRRPILVLSACKNEVAVFQITSQYDNKSAAIRSRYITIDDWAQAGLAKQSYIDIGKILELPISTIQTTPIGKLSNNDLIKLLQAIDT